jgi:type VI secretion system secreted protein Hcp
MAVDFLLKIDGIKGESQIDKHKDEVDVLAWSWGMTQTGTMHVGGGGGAGKVNVQDISVTKYVDKATPTLMKMCCSGKHIKEALFTARKAGDKPLDYLKIKMSDVVITSVNTGGSSADERLTENVTLNFARYEVGYTPQKPDGSGDAEIIVNWDMGKNVEK